MTIFASFPHEDNVDQMEFVIIHAHRNKFF